MSSTPVQTPPASALPAGYRFNEFEIGDVLGGGGFGIVYRAWDHQLERTIAIKEYMPASLAIRTEDGQLQPRSERQQKLYQAGLNSFMQEARMLARFSHPGLLNVLRFWEQNGTAYMGTLCYSGTTLKVWQQTRAPQIDESWIRQLLPPLFSAVAAIHQAGYLHRDISLDNIQIQDNLQPVLLDFGSARKAIGNLSDETGIMLKPGYAPIEQYSEEGEDEQGPWTDIYALGAVLHTLIAGGPPPVSVVRCIEDRYQPLALQPDGEYSLSLRYAVDQALAMSPAARPQSIAELAALLALSDGEVQQRLDAGILTLNGSAVPAPALPAAPAPAEKTPAPVQAGEEAAPHAQPVAVLADAAEIAAAGPAPRDPAPAPAAVGVPLINPGAASAEALSPATAPRRISRPLLALSGVALLAVAVTLWLTTGRQPPVAPAVAAPLATVYLPLAAGDSVMLNGQRLEIKPDAQGFATLKLAAGDYQLQVSGAAGVRSQTLKVDRPGSWLLGPGS